MLAEHGRRRQFPGLSKGRARPHPEMAARRVGRGDGAPAGSPRALGEERCRSRSAASASVSTAAARAGARRRASRGPKKSGAGAHPEQARMPHATEARAIGSTSRVRRPRQAGPCRGIARCRAPTLTRAGEYRPSARSAPGVSSSASQRAPVDPGRQRLLRRQQSSRREARATRVRAPRLP